MRQSFFQRDVEDKSEYADRDYLTRTYGADGEQIRLGNLIRKFEHKRHDYDVLRLSAGAVRVSGDGEAAR